MNKLKKTFLSWFTLPVLGLVITAFYLLGATWLLSDRVSQLGTMPLNEIGDFLAGIFGALAFFWLIIGYFMQNKELKNNNKSIELQVSELKETTKLSNRSLELQEAQWKYKRILDHNSAQPYLICKDNEFSMTREDNNHFKVCMTINNEGAEIRKFMMGTASPPKDGYTKVDLALIPKLEKNISMKCTIRFPCEYKREDLIELKIPVRFHDGNHLKQEMDFNITAILVDSTWKFSSNFSDTFKEV